MNAFFPRRGNQARRLILSGRIRFHHWIAALMIVGVALLATDYYATAPLKQPAAVQLPTATPTASLIPSGGQSGAVRVWIVNQPSIWPPATATAVLGLLGVVVGWFLARSGARQDRAYARRLRRADRRRTNFDRRYNAMLAENLALRAALSSLTLLASYTDGRISRAQTDAFTFDSGGLTDQALALDLSDLSLRIRSLPSAGAPRVDEVRASAALASQILIRVRQKYDEQAKELNILRTTGRDTLDRDLDKLLSE
jgi:hypothetical protein